MKTHSLSPISDFHNPELWNTWPYLNGAHVSGQFLFVDAAHRPFIGIVQIEEGTPVIYEMEGQYNYCDRCSDDVIGYTPFPSQVQELVDQAFKERRSKAQSEE